MHLFILTISIRKKGRTKQELHQVIEWLTENECNHISEKSTFELFKNFNPNAHNIKGLICGYRIEDITNSLTQKVRFLDNIDEIRAERFLRQN